MKIPKELKDFHSVLSGNPMNWSIGENGRVFYPSFLEYLSEATYAFDRIDFLKDLEFENTSFALTAFNYSMLAFDFIMSWIPTWNRFSSTNTVSSATERSLK